MKFRGLLYLCHGWVRRKGSVENFKSLEFYSFNINLQFWSFNPKIIKEIIRMCISEGGGLYMSWGSEEERMCCKHETLEFYYFNINLRNIWSGGEWWGGGFQLCTTSVYSGCVQMMCVCVSLCVWGVSVSVSNVVIW